MARKARPKRARPQRAAAPAVIPPVFPFSDDNPFGLEPTPELSIGYSEVASDAPATRHLPVWKNPEAKVWLYHGNCLAIMDQIAEKYPDGVFDVIFADPPYFLSNGGITCHAGRMVSVNKGERNSGPRA